jgi:transaldolase
MVINESGTKILLDGGDPTETEEIKALLGRIDGQTTNPSLVAKNPVLKERIAAGHRLTVEEQKEEYKKIVQSISPLVGTAGVSIEVFADTNTTGEEMLAQGIEMYAWIPNAYIKYPCTPGGLHAAEMSVRQSMRVNMTLCFTQEQAAAVYAATKATQTPVYVSPFIGRLDDHGQNGIDLIKNIKRMYESGDGHVQVLAASIRSVPHLLSVFSAHAELATVPATVLRKWAAAGCPIEQQDAPSQTGLDHPALSGIAYRELDLDTPWERFNIFHELTTSGIKAFVADYRNTVTSDSN